MRWEGGEEQGSLQTAAPPEVRTAPSSQVQALGPGSTFSFDGT